MILLKYFVCVSHNPIAFLCIKSNGNDDNRGIETKTVYDSEEAGYEFKTKKNLNHYSTVIGGRSLKQTNS